MTIDRGVEIIYNLLLNYFKKNGIQRYLILKYSQNNGVAKRNNRSVVKIAQSMLKGDDHPNSLRAEANFTMTKGNINISMYNIILLRVLPYLFFKIILLIDFIME